jgi:hypothetical protein
MRQSDKITKVKVGGTFTYLAGQCSVCKKPNWVVLFSDRIGRDEFAICSDCCQTIMAVHESEDL